MRAINNIIKTFDEQGLEGQRNFAPTSYTTIQNKEMPSFEMTRKGFMLLVMGFTGEKALKFKNDFVDAFDAMEEHIKRQQQPKQIPHEDIIRLAEKVLSQIKQIEVMGFSF